MGVLEISFLPVSYNVDLSVIYHTIQLKIKGGI